MFRGHFAVGFAAKRPAPSVSLGTLFLAAQWIDLVWPIFLLLGLEGARIVPGDTAFTPLDFYNYPYTHSLAAVVVWSVEFGAVYYTLKRSTKAALVLGAAVLSLLFIGAVAVYAHATRTRDNAGRYGLWALVAFLCLIYVANLLGPPPPDEKALAFVGLLQWIFLPWMYWLDRRREGRQS